MIYKNSDIIGRGAVMSGSQNMLIERPGLRLAHIVFYQVLR